ncbi:MAG TPA: hypothetical protein VF345_04740 [Chthoniobacterales bacterium]
MSPFSFAIYATVIKENMMPEDQASAIERVYREVYAKVESAAAGTYRDEWKRSGPCDPLLLVR